MKKNQETYQMNGIKKETTKSTAIAARKINHLLCINNLRIGMGDYEKGL